MIKAYNQDYAYKEHWQTKFDKEKAYKIVKKLARHFKVKIGEIDFCNYKRGFAYYSGDIDLPKGNIPLALITHEIGHILAFSKGFRGHTKRAYKYIHRVYRYSLRYIPTEILLGLDRPQLLLKYTLDK